METVVNAVAAGDAREAVLALLAAHAARVTEVHEAAMVAATMTESAAVASTGEPPRIALKSRMMVVPPSRPRRYSGVGGSVAEGGGLNVTRSRNQCGRP